MLIKYFFFFIREIPHPDETISGSLQDRWIQGMKKSIFPFQLLIL
jgi:hypothetical protein